MNIFKFGIVTGNLSAPNAFSSVHKPLFSTQIFMFAVELRVMSIDTPCHAIISVLEGQAQVGIECNYKYGRLHTRIYSIQGCPVEIQLDTAWPQQERPAACVIAHQYSSFTVDSLNFHSGKGKLDALFTNIFHFNYFLLLKIASIWNCSSCGLFSYFEVQNLYNCVRARARVCVCVCGRARVCFRACVCVSPLYVWSLSNISYDQGNISGIRFPTAISVPS